jgi:hypothetical protein
VGSVGIERCRGELDVRALTTNESSFVFFDVLWRDTELSILRFVVSSIADGLDAESETLVRWASTRMAPLVVCRKMLDVELYEPEILPFVVVSTDEVLVIEPEIFALVVEMVAVFATTDW